MAIPVFPTLPGISFPVVRKPLWKTVTQETLGGQRTRLSFRTVPQWQWEISFDLLRSAAAFTEFQNLAAFFNTVFGSAGLFYYSDSDDNAVSSQSFGSGDGSTILFQLIRTFGGFAEPVFGVNGPISVFLNGVPQTLGTNYSVGATGGITFTAPPGAGVSLTWTGLFFWLCRFDNDNLDFSKFMNQLWEIKKISFTSELL